MSFGFKKFQAVYCKQSKKIRHNFVFADSLNGYHRLTLFLYVTFKYEVLIFNFN